MSYIKLGGNRNFDLGLGLDGSLYGLPEQDTNPSFLDQNLSQNMMERVNLSRGSPRPTFFNSEGSSSDKFAEKNNPYISGEFGNIYQNKDYELIPGDEDFEFTDTNFILKESFGESKKKCKVTTNVSLGWAVVVAITILLVSLVLSLWNSTGVLFIQDFLNEGSPPTLTQMFKYASVGTILLVFLCWGLGLSFVSLFTGNAVDA